MKTGPQAVWLVVFIARSCEQADAVEDLLRGEGFLVQRGPLNSAISESGACELQVLKSEAEEARRFLSEKGL